MLKQVDSQELIDKLYSDMVLRRAEGDNCEEGFVPMLAFEG
jgi:hypothetical protein